jgi:hypothetical protein
MHLPSYCSGRVYPCVATSRLPDQRSAPTISISIHLQAKHVVSQALEGVASSKLHELASDMTEDERPCCPTCTDPLKQLVNFCDLDPASPEHMRINLSFNLREGHEYIAPSDHDGVKRDRDTSPDHDWFTFVGQIRRAGSHCH